jgi:hypothetical protein
MTAKRQGKRKTKTQKHNKQQKQQKQQSNVMTIPQLRKAFEHVETFVELHSQKPKRELVQLFQEEWKKTFYKDIERVEAEAYVEHALAEISQKHPRHRKHSGGALPLSGAPLLADTRPGVYISPGVNSGSYAQVPDYIDKGFWNPAIGRTYDPVQGQTTYPVYTPATLGSNAALKGGARQTQRQRRNQKGGGLMNAMTQFFTMRPIFSTVPPTNVLDDATTAAMAKPLPQSPDPSQSRTPYISPLSGRDMGLTGTPSGVSIPTAGNIPKTWFGSADRKDISN